MSLLDRETCVFCRICDGKEQSNILYQDEKYVVFPDIKPAAKHHFLIVTREHIRDVKSLLPDQKSVLEDLVKIGKQILEKHGADLRDVRFGFHWPPFHSISHLHLHVISPASEMGFMSRCIFRPGSWWFVTVLWVHRE
ncbi:adenosine 5'-monophosphoramidase HINT3-like isoform X2 [Bacillus rossius redtenbacheri]|uniref:adenosine 5'-monophosphoramidase HINT3-like isoform X2 n=1 Tax=Bacillus rossius redtenbacheri TaxID=93214 RepID=UPI002FDDFA71